MSLDPAYPTFGRVVICKDQLIKLLFCRGEPIPLNSWHTVRIERLAKDVSMFVNETLVKKHTSQSKNAHLDISKKDALYVGFVPEGIISHKVRKLNVPFEGELQELRINELPINLISVSCKFKF